MLMNPCLTSPVRMDVQSRYLYCLAETLKRICKEIDIFYSCTVKLICMKRRIVSLKPLEPLLIRLFYRKCYSFQCLWVVYIFIDLIIGIGAFSKVSYSPWRWQPFEILCHVVCRRRPAFQRCLRACSIRASDDDLTSEKLVCFYKTTW
jgi:hypothetical protein